MNIRVLLTAVLVLAWAVPGLAQTPTTPAPGSAERRAILQAVRPAVETQLGAPIEFAVKRMDLLEGWAFVALEPQRPGGGEIDVSQTRLADDVFLDGLTTYALLLNAYGRWNVIEWVIGPGDVAWADWSVVYGAPPEILGD
jgi:hypothetical protein